VDTAAVTTCERFVTLPKKEAGCCFSFSGDAGLEGVLALARLLAPSWIWPDEDLERLALSLSFLSSLSSYGDDIFSLDSLRLRLVTLLARLARLANEILEAFLSYAQQQC